MIDFIMKKSYYDNRGVGRMEQIKTKNGNVILLSVITFLLIMLVLLVKSNITYGISTSDTYNFEDLKVGDFIPFDSTIQVNEDYIVKNMVFSGTVYSYSNKVNLFVLFSKDSFKSCYYSIVCNSAIVSETIGSNEKYQLKNITDYVSYFDDAGYVGYEVIGVKDSSVYLIPVTDYAKINETPSVNNNYVIDTYFNDTDSEDVINAWYKIKNITEYETNDDIFWQHEDGTLHFLYKGGKNVGDTVTLTYTFEANVGDVVKFKTRSWSGASWYVNSDLAYDDPYDTYTIAYNGEVIDYPTGFRTYNLKSYEDVAKSVAQDSSLYEEVSLLVTESGMQTLTLTYVVNGNTVTSDLLTHEKIETYAYNYGYIKDLKVISLINEGSVLDTSKVQDGDEIYYESVDLSGRRVLGETLTYLSSLSEENDNETENKEVVKNPNTLDINVVLLVMFGFIVGLVLLISYKKFTWLK